MKRRHTSQPGTSSLTTENNTVSLRTQGSDYLSEQVMVVFHSPSLKFAVYSTSTSVLKRWAKWGQEQFSTLHWRMTTDELQRKVTGAYDDYYYIKKQKDSRDQWLHQLISAQAEAKNTTKARLWKQVRNREAARKIAAQAK